MAIPWTVIVPVKQFEAAKSRLRLVDANRQRLARAFALDTLAACRNTPAIGVVIVVSENRLIDPASNTDRWVRDPGGGINAALRAGARLTAAHSPILALLSDLPSIRSQELSLLLRLASDHPRAFLSDQVGTGSTALMVSCGSPLEPLFGPRSRAAHRRSGAIEIQHRDLIRARRDVDTPTDLADAIRLGLGPASRSVLGDL